MVYRSLTEYLLGRSVARPVPIWVGLVPIFFVAAGLAFRRSPGLVVFLSILGIGLSISLAIAFRESARRRQAQAGDLQQEEWLSDLTRFARERQLESRSHPRLIEDLESCARLRTEILVALRSSEWERLCRQPGWEAVRSQCEQSAQRLFADALWASKGAFRPLGGRRETFARRCQDPEFASAALGGVQLARAQLGKLLDEVLDDPFAAHGTRDALARAQAELAAIRDAEEELRQVQWPLVQDD